MVLIAFERANRSKRAIDPENLSNSRPVADPSAHRGRNRRCDSVRALVVERENADV
jgi:hypothetical protein